jgi:plasmid stabilization system protein ParE
VTELRLFDEASEEAEEASRWYRDRSVAAEASFLAELDHAVAVVFDAPHRWPKHTAGTRRYVFPTFPYELVYFVDADVISVVAVAHEKRRPGYWRKRLRK